MDHFPGFVVIFSFRLFTSICYWALSSSLSFSALCSLIRVAPCLQPKFLCCSVETEEIFGLTILFTNWKSLVFPRTVSYDCYMFSGTSSMSLEKEIQVTSWKVVFFVSCFLFVCFLMAIYSEFREGTTNINKGGEKIHK